MSMNDDLRDAILELEKLAREHRRRKQFERKNPHCPHHEHFDPSCVSCLETADGRIK